MITLKSPYIQERDNALFSLDEGKICSFLRKYDKTVPDNPDEFWALIYKVILAIHYSPEKVRKQAEEWLDRHRGAVL